MVEAQPTVNAPTPTQPAGGVLALYDSSAVYADAANINWYVSWGQFTSVGDYTIPGGNTVKSYIGLSYEGVEMDPDYNGGADINASAYNTLHADIWTTGNQIAVKLVSTDNGAAPEVIYAASTGVITSNHWVSLDIPMSAFTSLAPNLDTTKLDQLLWIDNGDIGGPGTQLADFYIDNVYFYNSSVVVAGPAQPTNNAPTPTRPANKVLAMYDSSGVYPEAPVDDWLASWSSAGEFNYTITNTPNVVLEYTALQYAGVEFYSPDQLDVSSYNTMHIDIWTPNANQFGVQLVSLDGGATTPAQVNISPASGQITTNHWISLDIPLNQFTAANPSIDLTALQQLLWIDNQSGGGTTGGTFYIDNVYFYSNSVVPPPPPQPTNNAPLPTRPASGVLAMYDSSGVYPEVPVDDWLASWSGANLVNYTITNTPNVVLEYTALQFAGVEFYDADQLDVTPYNTMHVDVWTPGANQFGIQLVSLVPNTQAGEVDFLPASGKITTNGWVSLDIPLSKFTTANPNFDPTQVQQLLWIDNQTGGGVTSGTFYIDNVYFYTSTTASAPTITALMTGGLHLSFATQNGFTYTVQYKNNLSDATWQTLSSVPGNNGTQSVPDTSGVSQRFYRVSVQ